MRRPVPGVQIRKPAPLISSLSGDQAENPRGIGGIDQGQQSHLAPLTPELLGNLEGDHTAGDRGEVRAAATYADVSHDEVLSPGGANVYRQRLWSLAAESEWRLGDSGRTRLSLGTVVDGSDTPESGDKPPLGRLTEYGFRLGMSSLVSEGLLVHGGVSRRARFPSLRELYSGALGRFEPNPDLTPETLLGAEGGFTLQRTGDVEFQVVGFY